MKPVPLSVAPALLVGAVICACLAAGCTSDIAWNQAQLVGTEKGYESFVQRYPEAAQATEARARIQALRTEATRWTVKQIGELPPDYDLVRSNRDGSRLACVVRHKRGARVVVDGEPGPEFDDIGSLVCSLDGKRVAYVGTLGSNTNWQVVIDGVPGPKPSLPLSWQCDGLVFSADGKRFAYVETFATEGEGGKIVNVMNGLCQKQRVVIDGVPGPTTNGVACLVFSPDGKRVAYAAASGGRWTRSNLTLNVERAGKKESHPIFVAVEPKWAAVIDGTGGPEFDEVDRITFGPDSKRVAYAGFRRPGFWDVSLRSGWVAMIDGVEKSGEEESPSMGGPFLFSTDSQHIAYAGSAGRVIRDGVPGLEKSFLLRDYSVALSPDGKRVAYIADGIRSDMSTLIVEGGEPPVQRSAPRGAVHGPPVFSPDSNHLAYLGGGWVSRVIVVDGLAGPPFDEALAGPTFLPDGTLECVVRMGSEVYRQRRAP